MVNLIRSLRIFLRKFEPEQLLFFDDQNATWLPRLRTLHPRDVKAVICDAVNSVESELEKLRCIASIHCWLIPCTDVRTWSFYLLPEVRTLTECTATVASLASSLTHLGRHPTEAVHASMSCGSVVYGCLMLHTRLYEFERHFPVYVVMWTTLPLMAARWPIIASQKDVMPALRTSLNGNVAFPLDLGDDYLLPAFQKAVAMVSETLTERERGQCTAAYEELLGHFAVSFSSEQLASLPSVTGPSSPQVDAAHAASPPSMQAMWTPEPADTETSTHEARPIAHERVMHERTSNVSNDAMDATQAGAHVDATAQPSLHCGTEGNDEHRLAGHSGDIKERTDTLHSETSRADVSSASSPSVSYPQQERSSQEESLDVHICEICATSVPSARHLLCPYLICPYCGLLFPEMTSFESHLSIHSK